MPCTASSLALLMAGRVLCNWWSATIQPQIDEGTRLSCASCRRASAWLASDTIKLINEQTITVRASGQVALNLRALPGDATICATLHVGQPDSLEIIAFIVIPA